MSVHNVEVFRCRECSEVVFIVPEGFELDTDTLYTAELDHYINHGYIEKQAGLVRSFEDLPASEPPC